MVFWHREIIYNSIMKILNYKINISTGGAGDFKDITGEIERFLSKSKLQNGLVTVFAIGSTCGITTLEFESGLIKDLKEFYERLVPSGKTYHHDATWGDANGFSHIRSALQGASFTVPFENAKLALGTWQQIVFCEFDNRPRTRKIAVQVMGI
jgi:secondary thiamine-phosphate synthase enzyme